MRTCSNCGGSTAAGKLLPVYNVPSLGLGVEVIEAVNEFVCEQCGRKEIEVPDMYGLLAAAAVTRAQIPVKLQAPEIRFLRKSLEMTSSELADFLEVTLETISRWENGKTPIGPSSEKLLRLLVGIRLEERTLGVVFDEQAVMRMRIQAVRASSEPVVMRFERVLVKTQERKEKQYSNIEEAGDMLESGV